MGKRQKGLSFYKKKKKISAALVKEILVWCFGIFAAVFIAFVVVYAVGMSTSMIGVSMEPALYNGQRVLINRYAYLLTSPEVGDVVVFLPNGNRNSHYYIKRVVAVPGDTVQIIGGRLYVNGEQIVDERYDKMAEAGIAENPLVLGVDEYFVLGDNRNNSEDSRSANIGPVRGRDILGRVWFHMGSGTAGMGFVE
ncbi:MAG: signal peptidase I [Lachnospiraceae bacterium]|nr:signal peptidase I [Lachnospiraceae bacterium]